MGEKENGKTYNRGATYYYLKSCAIFRDFKYSINIPEEYDEKDDELKIAMYLLRCNNIEPTEENFDKMRKRVVKENIKLSSWEDYIKEKEKWGAI